MFSAVDCSCFPHLAGATVLVGYDADLDLLTSEHFVTGSFYRERITAQHPPGGTAIARSSRPAGPNCSGYESAGPAYYTRARWAERGEDTARDDSGGQA